MDQQTFQVLTAIATTLISIIGAGVAWWVNNLWSMVRTQQDQITNLKVELAAKYMPREELQETLNRIFSLLEEIRKEVRHS